jgi:hypothetical protein
LLASAAFEAVPPHPVLAGLPASCEAFAVPPVPFAARRVLGSERDWRPYGALVALSLVLPSWPWPAFVRAYLMD